MTQTELSEWAGKTLPAGTVAYVFDGRATGHGKLPAGTPVIAGDPDGYPVGGCVVHAVPCGPSVVHVIGEPRPRDWNGTAADGRTIPAPGNAGGWTEIIVPE